MIVYPNFSSWHIPEHIRRKRIREGRCEYCGTEIDERDEQLENYCCDRRLWDWCCFQTYLDSR